MQIITYNGKMHVFNETTTDLTYPDEWFISRCWFIVKNMDRYKNDMKHLETLSHIWVAVTFLEAKYPDNVMDELNQCRNA